MRTSVDYYSETQLSAILLDPEFYEDIISFLKLIGDHFMDKVKRKGDHVEVGIILR